MMPCPRKSVNPLAAIMAPERAAAQVMRLFDEASEKRHAFRRELTASTLAFLATLTPGQRAKFVELARQPQRFWAHPPAAAQNAPASSGH